MSLKFEWKDEFSIGNEVIDAEHKNLFDIANRFFAIEDPKANPDAVKTVIVELYDYMRNHFVHEEAYMQEIAYPEINEQVEKHKHIISEMNLILKYSRGFNEVEDKLTVLMQEWLLTHIIAEDMKLKKYHV